MNKKVKVLITGANGFVGSAIVCELMKYEEFEIYRVSGLRGKLSDNDPAQNIREYQVDLCDKESIKTLEEIGELDYIVHTAGLAHQFGEIDREEFFRVNERGTANVCKLANDLKTKQFILISSVSVYGDYQNVEVTEKFECRPIGDYAESKLAGERIAGEICNETGMALTILRLATVIGEGDRGNVARLITQIDKNKFLWVGKGENKKTLIYKNDVAKIIYQLISRKSDTSGIYNVVSKPMEMREIVEKIYFSLNRKNSKIFIPMTIVKLIFIFGNIIPFRFFNKIINTIKKWVSVDIYSGKKLLNEHQIQAETNISTAIRRQTEYYLNKKNE